MGNIHANIEMLKSINYTTNEFNYVYTEDNTKVYYNDYEGLFTINANGIKTIIDENTGVVYKKLSVWDGNMGLNEYYQALCDGKTKEGNSVTRGVWYRNKKGDLFDGNNFNNISPLDDCSAINYYNESIAFSKWVYSYLNGIELDNKKIFNENEIEKEDSLFNIHKKDVIKNSLISSLNESITAYSKNSEGEYYLPIFTENDWEQIYRNISMVTFVQGIPIGLKKYNNYAVVTSTNNKEYINPDEIYLNGSDNYYHLDGCERLQDNEEGIVGYRNIDFKVRTYKEGENEYSYYRHNKIDGTPKEACYYCLIQKDLYKYKENESAHLSYLRAIAREKHNNRKTRLNN